MFMLKWFICIRVISSTAFSFAPCDLTREIAKRPLGEIESSEMSYYLNALAFNFANSDCSAEVFDELSQMVDARVEELDYLGYLDSVIRKSKSLVSARSYAGHSSAWLWDTLIQADMLSRVVDVCYRIRGEVDIFDFRRELDRMIYCGNEYFFLYQLSAMKRKIDAKAHVYPFNCQSALRDLMRFAAPAYCMLFAERMLYSPAFDSHNFFEVRKGREELSHALVMLKDLYPLMSKEGQAALLFIAGGLRLGFTSPEGTRKFLLSKKLSIVRQQKTEQNDAQVETFLAHMKGIIDSNGASVLGAWKHGIVATSSQRSASLESFALPRRLLPPISELAWREMDRDVSVARGTPRPGISPRAMTASSVGVVRNPFGRGSGSAASTGLDGEWFGRV